MGRMAALVDILWIYIGKRPEFLDFVDRYLKEYLITSIENNFRLGVEIDGVCEEDIRAICE